MTPDYRYGWWLVVITFLILVLIAVNGFKTGWL